MVCDRCIMVVRQQLEALHYDVKEVKLGEAEIEPSPTKEDILKIQEQFLKIGFELLEDKKGKLSERIKTLIIEKINLGDQHSNENFSDYLTEKIGLDYHHLSHVFSEVEGNTIEKFVIIKKIEKVKELLSYNELTISEIAWKIGYSSIQALSSQFKKNEGITPSEFKKAIVTKI